MTSNLQPTTEAIKVGVFFFIAFTAFSSYQSIVTHIYQTSGLNGIGPTVLAVNYLMFMVSTILAPVCPWSLKRQFQLGAIANTLNFCSGIIVTTIDSVSGKYLVASLGGLISGSVGGLMWVAIGSYLHQLCIQTGVQQHKGKYFAIFNTIYSFCYVSAGVITTFGLGFFDVKIYFFILAIVQISSLIFRFTLADIQINHRFTIIKTSKNQSISQQNQQDDNPKSKTCKQILNSLKEVFLFYPQMTAMIPILIIDGICLGIYSSQISHLIPDKTLQQKRDLYAGLATISLGIGATLGGFLSGKLWDWFGGKVSGRITMILCLISCGVSALTYYEQEYGLTLTVAFLWGLALFYLQGWIYVACSHYYKGCPQSFSIVKQVHSLVYLLFQFTVILTNNDFNLYYLFGGVSVLIVLAAIILERLAVIGEEQDNNKFIVDEEE